MLVNKTEKALVSAAKNGDTKSFEELYKLYYDKIYALALTMVKNNADAEDVLQMTFVKAWQNIEKLENVSAFSTWLQRIAINQCNSMLRKSNKQEYSINDEGDDGELLQIESDLMLPEQYAERDDLSIRLRAIIDELSVVQRETRLIHDYEELWYCFMTCETTHRAIEKQRYNNIEELIARADEYYMRNEETYGHYW